MNYTGLLKQLLILTCIFLILGCNKDENEVEVPSQGYRMLLIGNSFFRQYAENLENLVLDAGLQDHNATVVFRGGDNGRPINFWNDTDSDEHNTIKATLDEGNIEVFGMTAGKLPANPLDGFREWIEYAIQRNPGITIFLSIPPIDYPANWSQLALEYGYDSVQELYDDFVNNTIHGVLINQLREEFPNTKIYSIPTGWATLNLAEMKQNNLLLDDINMVGPKPTSIFTDQKGHQGQIVIETGTLIWLNSIYKIDLTTNSYNTGFNTNLHDLANTIMDNHDLNYSNP